MSNNWFNPNYPPPPLPGTSSNYNPQTNYNNWYSGAHTMPVHQQQPHFSIPPPNFNQPPPQHMYNPHYAYDYSNNSYYAQSYSNYSYGSSSTSYSDSSSLNYAEELESYRNKKADYERAHHGDDQKYYQEKSRTERNYSSESRSRRAR